MYANRCRPPAFVAPHTSPHTTHYTPPQTHRTAPQDIPHRPSFPIRNFARERSYYEARNVKVLQESTYAPSLPPNFMNRPLTVAMDFLLEENNPEHIEKALSNLKILLNQRKDHVSRNHIDTAITNNQPRAALLLLDHSSKNVRKQYMVSYANGNKIVEKIGGVREVETKGTDPLSRILTIAENKVKRGESSLEDVQKLASKFLPKFECCVGKDHLERVRVLPDPALTTLFFNYANPELKKGYLHMPMGEPSRVLSRLDPVNLMAK